jgi:hypothetical protein
MSPAEPPQPRGEYRGVEWDAKSRKPRDLARSCSPYLWARHRLGPNYSDSRPSQQLVREGTVAFLRSSLMSEANRLPGPLR